MTENGHPAVGFAVLPPELDLEWEGCYEKKYSNDIFDSHLEYDQSTFHAGSL